MAISDDLGVTAVPLATLARVNRREDIRQLRTIVREHRIGQIIVGLPLHLDGRTSEMAEEVKRFVARISKQLGFPVELVDERLTSWEAAQTEASALRKAGARSTTRDDVAAAIILRDYLEQQASRELRQKAGKA